MRNDTDWPNAAKANLNWFAAGLVGIGMVIVFETLGVVLMGLVLIANGVRKTLLGRSA